MRNGGGGGKNETDEDGGGGKNETDEDGGGGKNETDEDGGGGKNETDEDGGGGRGSQRLDQCSYERERDRRSLRIRPLSPPDVVDQPACIGRRAIPLKA
jgi:hypothetical protein